MAYIAYSQSSVGGKQLAEAMADLQAVARKLQNLGDWIAEITPPSALETNTDFSVASGQGQAFNDTFVQVAAAFASFMGDGSSGTNREKIARLARGS